MDMYIARILYPVKVLGPGCRVGIWFAGCPHACQGCSNPELWEQSPGYQTSLKTVMQLIDSIHRQYPIDGFTITGGEPFEQPEELAALVDKIKILSTDILIYTGYELSGLRERNLTAVNHILKQTAVLIDGRYQEEQNENCPLRGSANQKIHILQEACGTTYRQYLEHYRNEIQNFATADGIISVGIHQAGFQEALTEKMLQRGVEEAYE